MNAKPTILYGESNAQIMAEQIKTFEKAGYPIATALGRAAIEQALKSNSYALVILGHTLNKDDRHHLPYMVKKANALTRILVLHASCKHPKVDIAIDSRYGEQTVLLAIRTLMADVRESERVSHAVAVAVA